MFTLVPKVFRPWCLQYFLPTLAYNDCRKFRNKFYARVLRLLRPGRQKESYCTFNHRRQSLNCRMSVRHSSLSQDPHLLVHATFRVNRARVFLVCLRRAALPQASRYRSSASFMHVTIREIVPSQFLDRSLNARRCPACVRYSALRSPLV